MVLFVHGSGSSRRSPRNQFVARALHGTGLSTLLFDLLTRDEEEAEARDGHLRFNIPFLVERLISATRWIAQQPPTKQQRIGYFGASTGGAAALVAAAELGTGIDAIVSRGGRPDLAGNTLGKVSAPTLLIVGERDDAVLRLNRKALAELACPKNLAIVPKATHLFEEPGTLEQVATLASAWFQQHLRSA